MNPIHQVLLIRPGKKLNNNFIMHTSKLRIGSRKGHIQLVLTNVKHIHVTAKFAFNTKVFIT
ncbi:uncharacterized protein METZ01_LOCUS360833 [marine metagenome]|uniref:Uncharacterized protein n=1 Tax=marine metagenome TaxID=408172 RepID=A0A382SDP3_9ZZZZ